MKKIIVLTILLFSALAGFGQTEIKSEACEVYKAVLTDQEPLVISDSVRSTELGKYWTFSTRNPQLAIVAPETLKSYKKEVYWCEIKDFVNLEPKKTLISQAEVDSYFEKLRTDQFADLPFLKKYGTDHYYEFSNVGFNNNRDQALLTYKWQSISFTGSDIFYVVLSKINGKWKVIGKELIESS
jgi:hypothetical protein